MEIWKPIPRMRAMWIWMEHKLVVIRNMKIEIIFCYICSHRNHRVMILIPKCILIFLHITFFSVSR